MGFRFLELTGAVLDTVKLFTHVQDPAAVVARFSDLRETVHHALGVTEFKGSVGSMRARLRYDRLIMEGSLPKFYGKTTLEPGEIRAAITDLEARLGIGLAEADVWRVDVFADLALSHPVSDYLPLLGRAPRYKRARHGSTGVRYEMKRRHLVFYDKVAERRSKCAAVPAGYRGQNVLRYEMQLRTKVRKQLGYPAFTVADLTSDAGLSLLAERWAREFDKVEEVRGWSGALDTSDLKGSLARAGLAHIGMDTVLRGLERDYTSGLLTKGRYHSRRRYLRELDGGQHAVSSELARELSCRVREEAARLSLALNERRDMPH